MSHREKREKEGQLAQLFLALKANTMSHREKEGQLAQHFFGVEGKYNVAQRKKRKRGAACAAFFLLKVMKQANLNHRHTGFSLAVIPGPDPESITNLFLYLRKTPVPDHCLDRGDVL